jgi:Fe-S-cluster-containing hydrogenase component 2
MCITACPFGVISLHPEKHVAIKCDLCGGDPECVKHCPTGALKYLPASRDGLTKRRAGAKKIAELLSLVEDASKERV